MFRLFVSRTTARRPRNATPQLEALEDILSLSTLTVTGSNVGNQLTQTTTQTQTQAVTATNTSTNTATSNGSASNAYNQSSTYIAITTGGQSQTSSTSATQTSTPDLNGGLGS